ncbi:MAG: DUF362 domain-containing protein [Spirochaetota bacterium]|nr:DUF362 domain-containing protein [Spirochaetota bacterium]
MKEKIFPRRSFFKTILKLLGYSTIYLIPQYLLKLVSAYPASSKKSKIAVISSSDISQKTIERMVDKAFNEFGGVNRFIKKGMKVVIKPNIAWNSSPEQAHNTNPYLVETVARLCKNAGAKVTIFDRTCNSARLSYKASGIADAAKRAGVDIEFIDSRKYKTVDVPNGIRLKKLQVYKQILDADFVINMPIAKHHSSSGLSLSMKNLMGVIGGNRGKYHLGLHQNIVDFNKTVKVDLIICDALRILTDHGPNGGTPEDVKEKRTIIMGTNPVTVDAYAVNLFGIPPSKIEYISLASKNGMGEIHPDKINIIKKRV